MGVGGERVCVGRMANPDRVRSGMDSGTPLSKETKAGDAWARSVAAAGLRRRGLREGEARRRAGHSKGRPLKGQATQRAGHSKGRPLKGQATHPELPSNETSLPTRGWCCCVCHSSVTQANCHKQHTCLQSVPVSPPATAAPLMHTTTASGSGTPARTTS